ncbi:MAG: hypothetical protein E6G67_07605 [Actinobacteria bacterium]|nr:MAG: hypothetical protein E6G67_07605 [Actinomycetota bacterium]
MSRVAICALASVAVGLASAGCTAGPAGAPSTTSSARGGAGPTTATSLSPATAPEGGTKKRQRRPHRPLVTVAYVIDGDTIVLTNGEHVRLVQIDAPEVQQSECFAGKSTAVLESLIPPGTRVWLETDRALDGIDRYGRLLRYIHRGTTNVNLRLVRRGAASVWFYNGDRGRYAHQLYAAAREARAACRGLWRACPGTPLDPANGVNTGTLHAGHSTGSGAGSGCESGYSPCLPITGDLDCADVRRMGKAPVTVTGSDPYHLDGDHDGIGCE